MASDEKKITSSANSKLWSSISGVVIGDLDQCASKEKIQDELQNTGDLSKPPHEAITSATNSYSLDKKASRNKEDAATILGSLPLIGAIAAAATGLKAFTEQRSKEIFRPLRDELPVFELIVMATMSAGKSTLINALLGQELLPSRNEACTARVFKIEDYDEVTNFEAKITGGVQESSFEPVDAAQLAILNDSPENGVIEIKGNIPGIKNCAARLVIYDTPGPNNSRDESHSLLTKELLHDKLDGCILYVMNASQFGVNDDVVLLRELKRLQENSENHKDIIFVLNKVDVLDPEIDSPLSVTVTEVQKYLERHGFIDPIIIPLSAFTALLARKKIRGDRLTRIEMRTLDFQIEQAAADPEYTSSNSIIPISIRQALNTRYEKKIDEPNLLDKPFDTLIEFSGIRILEDLIETLLISHFAVEPTREVTESTIFTDEFEKLQNEIATRSTIHNPANTINLCENLENNTQSHMDMSIQSITLSYNPFTVKTKIEINGKHAEKGSLAELCFAKRLQLWIDKFFPKLFETLNSEELNFTFQGTDIDAIDVKDAIEKFNLNSAHLKINAKYKTTPIDVDERLKKLIALLHDAQHGPFDELKGLDISQALEKVNSDGFEVNVIATMSAGKSTLINSMLGLELMPAKNEACTATIAKISDHDDMDHFELRRFSRTHELLNDWTRPDDIKSAAKLLEIWNSESDTSLIEIKGNIPAIQEREGVKIVLVDTPGPNNSRDSEHLAVTYRAINDRQPSMVLYVLNATQLSTNDDQGLLNTIKEAMAKGGREAQDRFIFVANKIDCFDTGKGESIANAIRNVKSYLRDNGIENPLVVPASAELTKLIRINRLHGAEAFSRGQSRFLNGGIEDFCSEPEKDLVEVAKADIDESTYQYLRNQINTCLEKKEFHAAAEVLSGVPIIEALLNNYIAKHAIPAKIKDVVDSLKAAETSQKAIEKLNQIISRSDNELGAITRAIDSFKRSETRIKEADGFRAKVQLLKYEISAGAYNNRREIDKKIQLLSDELQDSLVGLCPPIEATSAIDKARIQIINLSTQIEMLLAEDLENEMRSNIESLQSEYKKFAEELLEKSFPKDELHNYCREFQSINLEMPDSPQLLKKSIYKKTITEKIGTERYGFLWLQKRDIFRTKEIQLVNLPEIADQMLNALKKASMENFEQFVIDGEKNLEIAKALIIQQMDEIDSRLEVTLQHLETALNNKALKEKQIAENQKKIEWFNQFNSQLNSILDV